MTTIRVIAIFLVALAFVTVSGARAATCDPGAELTGAAPLHVQFTDISTNTPTSWSWWFKDVVGNNTWIEFSTSQNPDITFSVTGNFSIRLNATNTGGTNSVDGGFVNVTSAVTAPVASFTIDKIFVRFPNTVTVTDTSTNSPTSWSWDWGDGTVASTFQSGSHQYARRGTFSIVLTATNSGGSDASNATVVRVIGYDYTV